MWDGTRFIVRRSPWMLGFQVVASLAVIGIGIWVLAFKTEPPPTEGQSLLGWAVIAGGIAGLIVLGLRARQPSQLLAIDGAGLHWWKADRAIRWAEVARVTIDTYRSTFYLHLKLRTGPDGVGTAPAHPLETLGSLVTGSDLSIRLSGSDARRETVREALEKLAPADVAILPARG